LCLVAKPLAIGAETLANWPDVQRLGATFEYEHIYERNRERLCTKVSVIWTGTEKTKGAAALRPYTPFLNTVLFSEMGGLCRNPMMPRRP
jgi:hypothetical protein